MKIGSPYEKASLLNLWVSQPDVSSLVSPESSRSGLSRGMHALGKKDSLAPTMRQSLAVYRLPVLRHPSVNEECVCLWTICICID